MADPRSPHTPPSPAGGAPAGGGISSRYNVGDFVECAFPYAEDPIDPGKKLHTALIIGIRPPPTNDPNKRPTLKLVYTSSVEWDKNKQVPWNILTVNEAQAKRIEQKPFYLDCTLHAELPESLHFFPRMNEPNHGKRLPAEEWMTRAVQSRIKTAVEKDEKILDPKRKMLEIRGPRSHTQRHLVTARNQTARIQKENQLIRLREEAARKSISKRPEDSLGSQPPTVGGQPAEGVALQRRLDAQRNLGPRTPTLDPAAILRDRGKAAEDARTGPAAHDAQALQAANGRVIMPPGTKLSDPGFTPPPAKKDGRATLSLPDRSKTRDRGGRGIGD